ncbi:MAG TPA: antitoxin family protein [Gemmataceae bacterium]|nr:antitoxin family protein [Gemmataceae bacterium]
MSITVEAIYENGTLRLKETVPLKEHETVRVTIESASAALPNRHSADLARLLAHAGAADLGKPTGADNEGIDADLAREYGSSRNGQR